MFARPLVFTPAEALVSVETQKENLSVESLLR